EPVGWDVPKRHIAPISQDVKTAFPRLPRHKLGNVSTHSGTEFSPQKLISISRLGLVPKSGAGTSARAILPTQRAMGIQTTFASSSAGTATPSRKATTLPELAGTRSPGTITPTRLRGSAADTVMISPDTC